MTVTDALLYQYAGKARDIVLNTLPPDDAIPVYHPSKRFNKFINRLIRQQNHSPQFRTFALYLKRTAAVAAVALVLTFSGLMTVKAFRDKVVDVMVTVFRAIFPAKISEMAFFYLPPNMECVEKTVDSEGGVYVYRDKNDGSLRFELTQINFSDDNYYATSSQIDDTLYIDENVNGENILTWNSDDAAYTLRGTLSIEEMTKIARNLRIADQPYILHNELPYIAIEYIPDGMVCTREDIYPLTADFYFDDKENPQRSFKLEQHVLTLSGGIGSAVNIFGENVKPTQINGNEAYMRTTDTMTDIVWLDGNVRYYLWGTLSREEMIRIAESIKEIKS